MRRHLNQSDRESKQQEKKYQNELLKYIQSERNKLKSTGTASSESVSSTTSESSKNESYSTSSNTNSEFKSFQLRYAKIVKENSRLLNDAQRYLKYHQQMETKLQTYYEMFQNANQKLIQSENTHKVLEDNLNKFINIAKQQILGKSSVNETNSENKDLDNSK